MTKAVLAARGLLVSTTARAAGPKLDPGDERELITLIEEARDLFRLHTPASRRPQDAA